MRTRTSRTGWSGTGVVVEAKLPRLIYRTAISLPITLRPLLFVFLHFVFRFGIRRGEVFLFRSNLQG